MYLLWKNIIRNLCPFLIGLKKFYFSLLLLRCMSFLYIFDVSPLSDIWFANILSHSTGCQKSSFSTFVPGLNLDCLSPTVYVPQVVTFEHLLCPAIQSLTLILQFLYSSSFSSTLWLAWFHKCPLVEVLPWILVPLEMALISWLVH